MTAEDRVRRYLTGRGVPDFVVEEGLSGLVRRWRETARSVRRGYPLGMDDYLNDLDGRQLISEVLPLVEPAERKKLRSRVVEADSLFRRHSKATRVCLWGGREARQRRWTSRKNWWYYRIPTTPGARLRPDFPGRQE